MNADLTQIYLSFLENLKNYPSIFIPISPPSLSMKDRASSYILQNSIYTTVNLDTEEIYSFDKKKILNSILSPFYNNYDHKVKYIVIPLLFIKQNDGHSVLLVLENKSSHIFDPYGKKTDFKLSSTLYQKLNKVLGIEFFNLIPESHDFLFQYYQEKKDMTHSGHCAIWCFWFIEKLNYYQTYEDCVKTELKKYVKNIQKNGDFIHSYRKNLVILNEDVKKMQIIKYTLGIYNHEMDKIYN